MLVFDGTNLSHSSFEAANLCGAVFRGNSDLTGADFTSAEIDFCDFTGAVGLTREQVERPIGSMATMKLPSHLL
jgi:uncharacterized protein YjbI with pentapeptide repeats